MLPSKPILYKPSTNLCNRQSAFHLVSHDTIYSGVEPEVEEGATSPVGEPNPLPGKNEQFVGEFSLMITRLYIVQTEYFLLI